MAAEVFATRRRGTDSSAGTVLEVIMAVLTPAGSSQRDHARAAIIGEAPRKFNSFRLMRQILLQMI
jgi:hypothetical protein